MIKLIKSNVCVFALSLVVIFSGTGISSAQTYRDSDSDTDYDSDYNYDYDQNFTYDQTGNTSPENVAAASLFFLGTILCSCIFIAILYTYYGISLTKIAEKTGQGENKLFAWLPILNIYLLTMIARKPGWWVLLFFLPIVNLVVSIIIWMEVSKATKHPEWIGILVITPIGILVPGFLAFAEGKEGNW